MRQGLIHSTINYSSIMKSLIIAGLLLGTAGAAQAGPYANVEANSGYAGSDYQGTATDLHVGYEGSNWYLQGGPTLVSIDGGDSTVELSGKAGASYSLSEALSVYGEVSFITGEDTNGYGTKIGAKYLF
jgi:hypothetical protein